MSVVELDDAVAVLGQYPALAGATLRVEHGEIVLLRGPNGAGKTTLLRLCAGLVPLVRGSGTVLGLDLSTHRESVRRTVGLLGHQNGLYLDLTVAENVRFWGSTVGASEAEMLTAMQRLDVAGRLADVVVSKLSAGDEVVTAGGVVGKVTEVKDSFVRVEIANGVQVVVQRHTIGAVVPRGTLKNI